MLNLSSLFHANFTLNDTFLYNYLSSPILNPSSNIEQLLVYLQAETHKSYLKSS